MPFVVIILLFLPFIDLALVIAWVADSPVPALLYLLATAVIGILLMKIGRIGVIELARQVKSVRNRYDRWLSGFAWGWLAGALLAFPGYISDVLAVTVFIIGFTNAKHRNLRKQQEGELQANAVDVEDEEADEEKDKTETKREEKREEKEERERGERRED